MGTIGGARPGAGRRPLKSRESFERARARKESTLATLRELELAKRRGELVEAEAVAREWSDVLRQVRAAVLAVTSRVRSQLPHLTAHDADVIDRELREALRALAEENEVQSIE